VGRPVVPDTGAGASLIWASWIGTALFVLGAVVAAGVADARVPVALLDVALFLGGCALFFWTLVVAARRSREVEIGLWSLFLLEAVGVDRRAPCLRGPHTGVGTRLLGALGRQVRALHRAAAGDGAEASPRRNRECRVLTRPRRG
jgi:hypothetical protein